MLLPLHPVKKFLLKSAKKQKKVRSSFLLVHKGNLHSSSILRELLNKKQPSILQQSHVDTNGAQLPSVADVKWDFLGAISARTVRDGRNARSCSHQRQLYPNGVKMKRLNTNIDSGVQSAEEDEQLFLYVRGRDIGCDTEGRKCAN